MKKLLCAAGLALSAFFFAGCTSTAQQNVEALATNAKTQVQNACSIVQPVLVDLSAAVPTDANLALLTTDNAKLCLAVAALDPTSVQSLISTVIPQAISLVTLLPMDPGTAVAVKLALGAASLALSNWLAVNGAPAAPADAASAPVAASQ